MDIMTALFDQEEVTRRFHLRLRNEGENKGKAEDVINIMDSLGCDRIRAMDILKIPQNERPKIIEYIDKS